MEINADVNANNWLTRYARKRLFRAYVTECECDKSCDVGEYLDYENCNCEKRLVDKLVEEYN